MQDSIFREYDIRGKVGTELLVDDVYDLTNAIAFFLADRDPKVRTIAVGMDGRHHSPVIVEKIQAALTDSGINVVLLGVCSTPVLYFALHTLPVHGGIMVTASHNPKEYNGMKICLGTASVWGADIKKIKELYKQRARIHTQAKGTITHHDILPDYVAWLADHFSHLKKSTLRVLVDCANGAAGTVLPLLVRTMQWSNVELLYPEVDGDYPNHEADPVKEENMRDVKARLAAHSYAFGAGLDGDCDRMAVMTRTGYLIPGDQLLAIFSAPVLQQHKGATVVIDIKSSSALSEAITMQGGVPQFSPSGHSIIKDMMRKKKAILGGELSCHFFFADRYFGYDDGIYAFMRVFELVTAGADLDALLKKYPKRYTTAEIRLACGEEEKYAIVDAVRNFFVSRPDVTLLELDGVRVATDDAWGIVRVSNTQPAISMRFEGQTPQALAAIQALFAQVLSEHIDADVLARYNLGKK